MRMRRRIGSPALNDTNYKIPAARRQLCQKCILSERDLIPIPIMQAYLTGLYLSYKVNSTDWLSPALTTTGDHMLNGCDGIGAALSSWSQLGDRLAIPRASQAARVLCVDLGVRYRSVSLRFLFRDSHVHSSEIMTDIENITI